MMKWCEHIEDMGKHWRHIDKGVFTGTWNYCPSCGKGRPKEPERLAAKMQSYLDNLQCSTGVSVTDALAGIALDWMEEVVKSQDRVDATTDTWIIRQDLLAHIKEERDERD